jgi:hypothetical protein
MKLRSLHEDSVEISFGQAMRKLCRNGLEPLLTSKKGERMDFAVPEKGEFFSLQGNSKEIAILATMYDLTGPTIDLDLLRTIPLSFPDLRERRTNKKSFLQGMIYALILHDIKTPVEPRKFAICLRTLVINQ